MAEKLSPEEVREKTIKILKEQNEIHKYVLRNIELEAELKSIQSKCPHENAYSHGIIRDEYECRKYANIVCSDCGYQWEEKVINGKCKYEEYKGSK